MTPREIGLQMAHLREQFKLSVQEVSERLHIRTRYLSAMEEGRYDLMPGKVYARGYVHTYAEFLGLDAEQVVAQCFANDNQVPHPLPPATRLSASASFNHSPWRSYAVMAVGGLVVLLLAAQISGVFAPPAPLQSSVAPVPDAILASVRNLMMPTALNHECLSEDALLSCFYADASTRALVRRDDAKSLLSMGDADLAALIVPLAEEPAAAEITSEPAAEEADEKLKEVEKEND